MKTALIIGATGLVGKECLKHLLASDNCIKVVAIVRKPLNIQHPKLETVIVDFNDAEQYIEHAKADDVYCAMGTTIAKAGSQQAFRFVDYEIPLKVAEAAVQNGAKKFILVSSIGASASSSIFYSRTKGELEEALKQLGYTTLVIFRPSLLLGERNEKRTGEAIAQWVANKLPFLFSGPLKKYKGIEAGTLAKAMVIMGTANNKGVRVIENEEIFKVAGA